MEGSKSYRYGGHGAEAVRLIVRLSVSVKSSHFHSLSHIISTLSHSLFCVSSVHEYSDHE